jgi:hypothetical protein
MSEPAENIALQAQDATPPTAGTGDDVAEFKEILAELEAKEAAENGEKPAPAKAKEPAEKKPEAANDDEPAPKKKGIEGKKTPAQYAAERVRTERDAARERLAEREAEVATLRAALASAESHAPGKLKELAEHGKTDEIATLMGFESWEALNSHIVRLYSSPEYKRIRELEKRDSERTKAEEDRVARETASRRAAEYQEQIKAATIEIGETLKGSENEVLALHAEYDPHFAAEVTRRIVAAGTDEDLEGIALRVAADGEKAYRALHKIYGDRPTEKDESSQEESPNRAGSQKKPEKPHKHVSRNSATEASAELPDELSDEEFYRTVGPRLMREAHQRDDEERRKKRA